MNKSKTPDFLYAVSFAAVNIFQIILVGGVMTTEYGIGDAPELYIDGEDLTPIAFLLYSGVSSFFFVLSVLFAVLLGVIIPLIAMLTMRRLAEKRNKASRKRADGIFTLILSLVYMLIGFAFSGFTSIGTVMLMYLPTPVISWAAFHMGKANKK